MTTAAFCEGLRKALDRFATRPVDPAVVDRLLSCVSYVSGGPEEPVGPRMIVDSKNGTRRGGHP